MIVQPHNIDAAPAAKSPVLVHTLGIPGAGKSTFLNILQQKWNLDTPACLLGFDQIMTEMPEYQDFDDISAAFAACEIPARETGYRLLDNLIARRAHILFDNGGSAAHHVDLLQEAKNAGYRIVIVSLTVPIALAQQRVDSRLMQENRATPPHYLIERLEKIMRLDGQYRHIADAFYELPNNGDDAVLFQRKAVELVNKLLHDLGTTKERLAS